MGKKTHENEMKVRKISALTQAGLVAKIAEVEDRLFEKLHCVVEGGKLKRDLTENELKRSAFFAQLPEFYPADVTHYADETSFERELTSAHAGFDEKVKHFCDENDITSKDLLQDQKSLYLAYLNLIEAIRKQQFYLSRFHSAEKAITQAKALKEAGVVLREAKTYQGHVKSRTPQPEALKAEAEELTDALVYSLRTSKEIGLRESNVRPFDPNRKMQSELTNELLTALSQLPERREIDTNKLKDKNQDCLNEAALQRDRLAEALSVLTQKKPESAIRAGMKTLRSKQQKWQQRFEEASKKLKKCHLPDLSEFNNKLEKVSVTNIVETSKKLREALSKVTPMFSTSDSAYGVAQRAIANEIEELESAFRQYLKPFTKLKGKYDGYTQDMRAYETWLEDLSRHVQQSETATELAIQTYEQACYDLASTKYDLEQFLKPEKFQFLRFFGKCCVVPQPLQEAQPAKPGLSQASLFAGSSMEAQPAGSGSDIHIKEVNAFDPKTNHSSSDSDEEIKNSPKLRVRNEKPTGRGLMTETSEEGQPLIPGRLKLTSRRSFGNRT